MTLKPTPSGQMIIDVVKQKMPGYIDGGMDTIDIEDVAHVLSFTKKRAEFGRKISFRK